MEVLRVFALLIAILYLDASIVASDPVANYCYADDRDPYIYTGTKTPYHFVHGVIQNTTLPHCKPLQIWMLCRHGTRNPGSEEIRNMLNILPDLQRNIIDNHEKRGSGSLCKKDLEHLKGWKLKANLSVNEPKFLTEQGEIDLESLGRRFKNYFPELLQSNASDMTSKMYKFKSTNTQRTIKSMRSFINGLFGNKTAVEQEVLPLGNEALLKVYKTCKPWLEEMNSPQVNKEQNAFVNGPEFGQLIRNVSRRLGFPKNLTMDVVWLMYKACVFEKAWHVDEISPWCSVFTKDELRIFEYEDDLYYYYHTGFGEKMASRVGCPPLMDMFTSFSKVEKGDVAGEPDGSFYFAHSVTLQTFYTAMGIANDSVPPTASNFRIMGDRKIRSSFLTPFATNFAAVFYKCDSGHKVRFYLAEKPLEYEGCAEGVCDWDFLKKKLGSVAFNCNVDFCQI